MKESQRGQLGLTSATGVVISSMVGAGVFTTSGFSLADLGSPALVLLAWAVAGVIAMCGAIGYGALARKFQESGGEYLFLSRTIHPAVGFLAGCVSLLAGFTGAIAFAATALEAYLPVTAAQLHLPEGSIAILAIVLATTLHLFRVEWGAQTQNLLVAGKFLLLLMFLVVAVWKFPAGWQGLQAEQPLAVTKEFSWTAFCMSLVWISLSYCGFNASVYIAGEVRDPARNVPLAMWSGTLLVTLFYLALNAVFVFAPSAALVSGEQQVAIVAAHAVGGDGLAEVIRWAVLVSLFTSVSVMIMTGPRVYAKMAEDGLMPAWISFHHHTPWQAICLQALLASLVVMVSTLEQLLSYLGFTLSLCAAIAVASLFWMKSDRQPGFAVRAAALFYVVCTILIACLAATRTPIESGLGLLTVLCGGILYFIIRPRSAS